MKNLDFKTNFNNEKPVAIASSTESSDNKVE